MAKPFPTDHSIMKLAVAAEQHRKMNMASSSSNVLTNPTVAVKKEEIVHRKPVIESTNSKPSPHAYQGGNLITHHKAGSKRKK